MPGLTRLARVHVPLAVVAVVGATFGCDGKAGTAAQADAAPATAQSEPSRKAAAMPAQQPEDEPAYGESPVSAAADEPIIDHTVKDIGGEDVALSSYRGKAVLIVNTASQCGFTPQYKGLQRLYGEYKDRGLVVLGFPSNDYGNQEPGTNEEIASFVDDEFGVQFPMMDKIHTKGPDMAPLYATLTEQTPEGIRGEVKWNFTKFLVDPDGKVVARFDTKVDPESDEVKQAIEAVLPESSADASPHASPDGEG